MNTADVIAGGIIGGIIWALLSYAVISLLFTVEDNAADPNRCPHCPYTHPVATMVADHITKTHGGTE